MIKLEILTDDTAVMVCRIQNIHRGNAVMEMEILTGDTDVMVCKIQIYNEVRLWWRWEY